MKAPVSQGREVRCFFPIILKIHTSRQRFLIRSPPLGVHLIWQKGTWATSSNWIGVTRSVAFVTGAAQKPSLPAGRVSGHSVLTVQYASSVRRLRPHDFGQVLGPLFANRLHPREKPSPAHRLDRLLATPLTAAANHVASGFWQSTVCGKRIQWRHAIVIRVRNTFCQENLNPSCN